MNRYFDEVTVNEHCNKKKKKKKDSSGKWFPPSSEQHASRCSTLGEFWKVRFFLNQVLYDDTFQTTTERSPTARLCSVKDLNLAVRSCRRGITLKRQVNQKRVFLIWTELQHRSRCDSLLNPQLQPWNLFNNMLNIPAPDTSSLTILLLLNDHLTLLWPAEKIQRLPPEHFAAVSDGIPSQIIL